MAKINESYGPLIFWALLFTCASVLKVLAYNDFEFWIDIPVELTIWSTGIFFTIICSENINNNVRTKTTYTPKSSGKGFEVDFDVELGTNLSYSNINVYLFTGSLILWIISLILKYEIKETLLIENYTGWKIYISSIISYVLATITTVLAIRSSLKTIEA